MDLARWQDNFSVAYAIFIIYERARSLDGFDSSVGNVPGCDNAVSGITLDNNAYLPFTMPYSLWLKEVEIGLPLQIKDVLSTTYLNINRLAVRQNLRAIFRTSQYYANVLRTF